MINKEAAYNKISELVERFSDQYDSYKKSDYNETLTRRDFVDPFFKALGWDIDNENGYAESYREVIHEDKVKVGKATKAPDYSFRLVGGKRLFFVEAKKPSVSVKDEIHPAYQVRRYGWSAKLPISIITDFEEFSVYDCTKKPKPTDKASSARIKYLTFREYLTEFDFLWDTFSKERVLKGSFDKFVQSDTHKKGTATVDKEFLQSLDSWRTYLATSISWNNKDLDEDEINFVVQQTIDRIIFLRIAEDRSVEPYGTLKEAIKQGEHYKNLFRQFEQADEKYNSGLFDFKKDKISKNIQIDNKVIKTIVNELYYPESPYEFSVLSVEILGSAYEQFLGKTITIDKAHRAKIEEKPEVRKAGGVYYTPQYVVDYIVQNTVGKLLENKTPKEVSKIKIVDPACGSGSFLIGAYQYLLDWHKNFYSDNGKPSKGKKDNPLTPEGNLTTAEKKRILLNNIFGVDIDVNAVEVTKLSLLLKCMEGETEASIASQLRLFNERVLPTLDENIKSGNSLVDTDFYDSQLDFGEEKKIKPFNWQKAFPEVFKQGGFDAVIGNPPYVLGRETFDDSVKSYIANKYQSYGGKYDLYVFFCEKALKLLTDKGRFSFIIPNTILVNENATKIRELILKNYSLETIRVFKNKVFENAQVETVILIIENRKPKKENNITIEKEEVIKIPTEKFLTSKNFKFNVAMDDNSEELLEKISACSVPLGELTETCIGIQLGGSHGSDTKADFLSDKAADKTWKKVLDGKDINTYKLNWRNVFVHYGNWLHRKRDEKYFLNPKILIRQIGKTPVATYDENDFYTLNTLYNIISISDYSPKFLLAIINSSLGKWFWVKKNSDFKTLFPKIKKSEIEAIPVCKIDFKNKTANSLYNEVIKNVDSILKLNEEITNAKLATQVSQLQGKIDYCEERINQIVYQLYDLTDEEIKIVEGR
ncbi:MAG TPA: TaqI-like C-terminal specificity domain-containing protein [Bacteroidales bacterium]|nr:TaqI-like C-terminal specificity domain-containing protein [Bacteroidales bacterium]